MQLDRVDTALFAHIEARVPETGALGVAVSGGGDSMALLVALAKICKARGQMIEAITVDHGLRPEAVTEADTVRKLCNSLDVAHATARWTGWNGEGNLQDAARQARYRLIAEWGNRRGLVAIMIGHTRDDVAETFLMRMARESGLDGLARMPDRFVRNNMQFLRPMLDLYRKDLRDFLKAHGISWADDPSNDNEAFERVRLRRALDVLEDNGISRGSLAAVSENLGQAHAVLQEATLAFAESVLQEENGDLLIERHKFLGGKEELRRRLMLNALCWVSGADYGPRRAPLKELDQALAEGRSFSLHGCLIRPTETQVRILREYNVVRDLVEFSPGWDRWLLNGPWEMGMRVSALGEPALSGLSDWRSCGVGRQSLMASPAVWKDDRLIAAPLAGFGEGWSLVTKTANFLTYLTDRR